MLVNKNSRGYPFTDIHNFDNHKFANNVVCQLQNAQAQTQNSNVFFKV